MEGELKSQLKITRLLLQNQIENKKSLIKFVTKFHLLQKNEVLFLDPDHFCLKTHNEGKNYALVTFR